MLGFTEVDELDKNILNDLFHGEAQIVSVKSSYNKDLCDSLKKQILESLNVGFYENAPKIGRIGMAFFESISSEEKRNFYYENAKKWNDNLFDACFPIVSPIDELIHQLKKSWGNASVAKFNEFTMFSGLARIFKDGSSAEPHQDIFLRDAPELFDKNQITEQLAYNIYLDVPEHGGEVELWNWKASDDEFKNLQNPNPDLSYGMDRNRISPPDIKYKPKKGDVLLFNPRNVHAVSSSYGTQRLTISTFIGYQSDEKELVLWS